MRGSAILLRIGFLATGILGTTSIAWGCGKQPAATESACSTPSVTVTTPVGSTPVFHPTATTAVAATPSAAPAEPGMRAYLDPETGLIGGPGALPPPSPEEAQALVPELQAEPVETVLPDGSVMLELNGRGLEYFVLQLDADGNPVVRCVQDPKTALRTAPSPMPEER
jgi:hypothetical protein